MNKEAIPTPGVYKKQSVNANYELKSQKSKLWNASQVGIIIRNEVYIETFIGRKLSTVRPWETKRNEESEYIKIEGHHEGLVIEELFKEGQKAIRKDELTKQEAESRRELEFLDWQMAETVLGQNSLEETMGMTGWKLSGSLMCRCKSVILFFI